MLRFATHFVINAALERLGKRNPYHPLYAVLYVTYRCNLSCTYCDDGRGLKYPDRPSEAELSPCDMLTLLGRIRGFADVLNLCGGEPLVRPDLEDLVDETKRLGFRQVLLSTNGVGLEVRTRLLGKVDYFLISLDTVEEAAAGELWGGRPGTLGRVLAAIEWVAGLRRRYRHKVVVNGVITPDNISHIHDVVDWALTRDIAFSASPQMVGIHPAAGLRDNPAYRELIDRLIALRNRGHKIVGSNAFLRQVRTFEQPYSCRPMQSLVNIRPDGRVYYPCNRLHRPAGSLLELGSLKGAVDQGIAAHGEFGECDGCCPTLRYMSCALAVQNPALLGEDLAVVGRRVARDIMTRIRNLVDGAPPGDTPGGAVEPGHRAQPPSPVRMRSDGKSELRVVG